MGNTMENAIRGLASFGRQDMDVRMEVDTISESLDCRHHSWHKLKACDSAQKSHNFVDEAGTGFADNQNHGSRCPALNEPLGRRQSMNIP
jgi:hypothetical protein